MWLNHLFIDSPIDFEKRCRNRVWIGVLFLVLGNDLEVHLLL